MISLFEFSFATMFIAPPLWMIICIKYPISTNKTFARSQRERIIAPRTLTTHRISCNSLFQYLRRRKYFLVWSRRLYLHTDEIIYELVVWKSGEGNKLQVGKDFVLGYIPLPTLLTHPLRKECTICNCRYTLSLEIKWRKW